MLIFSKLILMIDISINIESIFPKRAPITYELQTIKDEGL